MADETAKALVKGICCSDALYNEAGEFHQVSVPPELRDCPLCSLRVLHMPPCKAGDDSKQQEEVANPLKAEPRLSRDAGLRAL